jgi:hypothetical protein
MNIGVYSIRYFGDAYPLFPVVTKYYPSRRHREIIPATFLSLTPSAISQAQRIVADHSSQERLLFALTR